MLKSLSRIGMSERFSLPHIHQPDKWCQGLSRVLELRFAFFDFRRRDVGQLAGDPGDLALVQLLSLEVRDDGLAYQLDGGDDWVAEMRSQEGYDPVGQIIHGIDQKMA